MCSYYNIEDKKMMSNVCYKINITFYYYFDMGEDLIYVIMIYGFILFFNCSFRRVNTLKKNYVATFIRVSELSILCLMYIKKVIFIALLIYSKLNFDKKI